MQNHFRHLKFYSNPPRWVIRSCCHMGTFWNAKGWSLYFWQGQPFNFYYAGIHQERRLRSTKTGIFTKFRALVYPEIKILVSFLRENIYIRKMCCLKAKDIWFKNKYFSSSACCIRVTLTDLDAFIMAWWMTCDI